jgi:guanylate kinase
MHSPVGAGVATQAHSRLTVLSGPSGVGKSTVVAELRQSSPEIWFSVSVTTRKPRPGEVDGRDYYFVDDKEFDRLVADGELLEWAAPHGTHRSGTPRRPIEDKLKTGVPCLLDINLAGARQVKRVMPDAYMVFLTPPSWDELVRRLTCRGTESAEVIDRRLATAREELAAADEFDITLVNASVTEVCRQLVALIEPGVSSSGSLDPPRGLQGGLGGWLPPGVDRKQAAQWQGHRSPRALSTRRSTSFLGSWTASTGW